MAACFWQMLSYVGGGILSAGRKFKSKNRRTEKENLVYLSLCYSLRVVLLHQNKKKRNAVAGINSVILKIKQC
jgi:hypothetical protein